MYESGNPADWACWGLEAPNGHNYVSFAPVEGEYQEPGGIAATMIRTAMQGRACEWCEWVYQIDDKWPLAEVLDALRVFGFKLDPKGSHLLNFFSEQGAFEPEDHEGLGR